MNYLSNINKNLVYTWLKGKKVYRREFNYDLFIYSGYFTIGLSTLPTHFQNSIITDR